MTLQTKFASLWPETCFFVNSKAAGSSFACGKMARAGLGGLSEASFEPISTETRPVSGAYSPIKALRISPEENYYLLLGRLYLILESGGSSG